MTRYQFFYRASAIYEIGVFNDRNKIVSANSFILNIFVVAALNATGYANFSIVELDRSIKR